MKNSYNNPFSGVNASQLDINQIIDYWCSPFAFKLFPDVNESDIYEGKQNIVLMGGRSTGKSMFLRYWSFDVQYELAKRKKVKLLQRILENKGIGFYFRISGSKLKSFYGYGFNDEYWTAIFEHYFELLIGREFIELLNLLSNEDSIMKDEMEILFLKFNTIFDFEEKIEFKNLLNEIDNEIKDVEVYLGHMPFNLSKFKPQRRVFKGGKLSLELPELILKTVSKLNSVNFIILLDEYENFLEYQQRALNTLLRFTKPNVKFRIGMRLEGFKTFSMINNEDYIQETREYTKFIFEDMSKKNLNYKRFLKEICQRRLKSIEPLNDKGFIDIEKILSPKEDLEKEALEIYNTNPKRIVEFFQNKINIKDLNQIRYPENPLMELLNCIWLTRGVTVKKTISSMKDFINKVKSDAGQKYSNDYVNKYKLSLTFLLCSIYKRNKQYYSFNTYSHLSSGIVGHFLELCRRAFAEVNWEDENGILNSGNINRIFQDKAAREFSNSKREQIVRVEKYGGNIFKIINSIGNTFKEYHRDLRIRYPETNQFTVDISSIQNSELKETLKAAIRWSDIQKKPNLQRPSPSESSLKDTYTINRIYSPAFLISYRTRGGLSIELDENILSKIVYEEDFNLADHLGVNKVKAIKSEKDYFGDLFGDLNE